MPQPIRSPLEQLAVATRPHLQTLLYGRQPTAAPVPGTSRGRDGGSSEGGALPMGQLLALTGAVTVPAGGGDVLPQMTEIVDQVGFGKVTAAGDPVILPFTATYWVLPEEIRWTDGYRGGGTVKATLTPDGPYVPYEREFPGSGRPFARLSNPLVVAGNAGETLGIVVAAADGAERTAEVTVRVALKELIRAEPRAIDDTWTQVSAADVWDLVFDGTFWWTTEGASGNTISKRDADWTELSTFEADLGGRVRGLCDDGTHLYITGLGWSAGAEGYRKYTRAGALVQSVDADIGDTTMGMAFDGTYIWISDSTTRQLKKYDTSGSAVGTWTMPADIAVCRGMTFYGGMLHVVDAGDDRLYRLDPADPTVVDNWWDISGATGTPDGVWIDDDGGLYIAQDGAGVWFSVGLLLTDGGA